MAERQIRVLGHDPHVPLEKHGVQRYSAARRLVTVPAEQYESADLDGASAFQKFRYITTPQMWYSVFFALIFSVINAFKCFREIFLIGGEHPVDELYMLQHFINNCFSNLNYQKLSVASVLLLIVIIVFFGLFYAFVSRKEAFRE